MTGDLERFLRQREAADAWARFRANIDPVWAYFPYYFSKVVIA